MTVRPSVEQISNGLRSLGLRRVGREELPARAQLLQEAHRVATCEDVEGKENHRAEIRDRGETARQAGRHDRDDDDGDRQHDLHEEIEDDRAEVTGEDLGPHDPPGGHDAGVAQVHRRNDEVLEKDRNDAVDDPRAQEERQPDHDGQDRRASELARLDVGPCQHDAERHDEHHDHQHADRDRKREEEQAVAVKPKRLPRRDHCAAIVDDAIEEHELAATLYPEDEETDHEHEDQDDQPDGDDGPQIRLDPFDGLGAGGAAAAAATGGHAAAGSLSEIGEEGAEAQDEPLPDVERLEEDALRSIERGADGICDGKGHGRTPLGGWTPAYHRPDRVERLNELWRCRRGRRGLLVVVVIEAEGIAGGGVAGSRRQAEVAAARAAPSAPAP